MTDFSSAIRIVTTLVLVLASILVWRWLQAVSATSGHATTATATATAGKKKPTKKKTTRKKKKAVADAATPSTTTVDVVDANVAMAVMAAPNDSEDDSDDDDAGLTAKQILARRRFKPKAFGGQSAAAAAAVTAEAVSAARFQVGQRIVARFQDGPDWFPGEILEVRRGNEYHVKYDDGEVERHVPHARIQDEAAAKQAEAVKGVSDTRLNANAEDEADGSGSSYASEDHDGDESEDGWQVVDKKRRSAGSASAPVPDAEKVDAEGLTKRQRENRRKKERKKELKEMIRAQAQEQGLHARWGGTMSRLKYVPPPTSSTPPS